MRWWLVSAEQTLNPGCLEVNCSGIDTVFRGDQISPQLWRFDKLEVHGTDGVDVVSADTVH